MWEEAGRAYTGRSKKIFYLGKMAGAIPPLLLSLDIIGVMCHKSFNFQMCNIASNVGTEELAHLEMVGAIVRQLTKGLSAEELEAAGFAPYYVDHTAGIWPQAAGGIPFNACEFQSKGDAITDLFEDMAAEQKARTTYDNILRLVKDPEVCDPIRFLRQREIVHFQRFGEGLRMVQDELDSNNFYMCNPEFDPGCGK